MTKYCKKCGHELISELIYKMEDKGSYLEKVSTGEYKYRCPECENLTRYMTFDEEAAIRESRKKDSDYGNYKITGGPRG